MGLLKVTFVIPGVSVTLFTASPQAVHTRQGLLNLLEELLGRSVNIILEVL